MSDSAVLFCPWAKLAAISALVHCTHGNLIFSEGCLLIGNPKSKQTQQGFLLVSPLYCWKPVRLGHSLCRCLLALAAPGHHIPPYGESNSSADPLLEVSWPVGAVFAQRFFCVKVAWKITRPSSKGQHSWKGHSYHNFFKATAAQSAGALDSANLQRFWPKEKPPWAIHPKNHCIRPKLSPRRFKFLVKRS